jgi:hypothetical protein
MDKGKADDRPNGRRELELVDEKVTGRLHARRARPFGSWHGSPRNVRPASPDEDLHSRGHTERMKALFVLIEALVSIKAAVQQCSSAFGWKSATFLLRVQNFSTRMSERRNIVKPRGGEAWNEYVQNTGKLHRHA